MLTTKTTFKVFAMQVLQPCFYCQGCNMLQTGVTQKCPGAIANEVTSFSAGAFLLPACHLAELLRAASSPIKLLCHDIINVHLTVCVYNPLCQPC